MCLLPNLWADFNPRLGFCIIAILCRFSIVGLDFVRIDFKFDVCGKDFKVVLES